MVKMSKRVFESIVQQGSDVELDFLSGMTRTLFVSPKEIQCRIIQVQIRISAILENMIENLSTLPIKLHQFLVYITNSKTMLLSKIYSSEIEYHFLQFDRTGCIANDSHHYPKPAISKKQMAVVLISFIMVKVITYRTCINNRDRHDFNLKLNSLSAQAEMNFAILGSCIYYLSFSFIRRKIFSSPAEVKGTPADQRA